MRRFLQTCLMSLLFAGVAFGQGIRKQDIVITVTQDNLLHAAPGSSIRVCADNATGIPCSPLSSIFSDPALTQPLTNPTTADSQGNYFFYIAAGTYQIQISGFGVSGTQTFPDVSIGGSGGGGGGTPCTTTALSLQYNAAGAFGCEPDLTFVAPHTLTAGASGIFDFSLLSSFKVGPLTSSCVNPATAGELRLCKTDTIGWLNNAASGNNVLGVNSSDQLTYNGVNLRGVFGPSGGGHSIGLVPDPGAVAGTARFLAENGVWKTPYFQLPEALNTIFNVADYGTVGDCTTDDTAAFQSAINAVSAASGNNIVFYLLIPPAKSGCYRLSGTLTFPGNHFSGPVEIVLQSTLFTAHEINLGSASGGFGSWQITGVPPSPFQLGIFNNSNGIFYNAPGIVLTANDTAVLAIGAGNSQFIGNLNLTGLGGSPTYGLIISGGPVALDNVFIQGGSAGAIKIRDSSITITNSQIDELIDIGSTTSSGGSAAYATILNSNVVGSLTIHSDNASSTTSGPFIISNVKNMTVTVDTTNANVNGIFCENAPSATINWTTGTTGQLTNVSTNNCGAVSAPGGQTVQGLYTKSNTGNLSTTGTLAVTGAASFSSQLNLTEIAAPSGISSTDVCWGDSTLHGPKCNSNTGGALPIFFITGPLTPGHCIQAVSANTGQDNGGACGSGGTGTVTSVTCGNLSPLFTCAVATGSTTPAISFALSNFTAHRFYGNSTTSTGAPAANLIGVSDIFPNAYAADSGAADAAVVTLVPAATALTAGLEVDFLPIAPNATTTPTVNVSAFGAKTITKLGTAALVAGDMTATAIAKIIYDGTEFQLLNPQTVTSSSGVIIQTNSVNNTTQTTLNFTNTAGPSGINFSNPGTSIESATLASVAGGGNATLQGTLTGPSQGDYVCENSSVILVNCTPGVVPNAQTGTSYTLLTGDRGKDVTQKNTSAAAYTLPQANTTGFTSNWYSAFHNLGTGAMTITPTTSTINSGYNTTTALTLIPGEHAYVISDNINYFAQVSGMPIEVGYDTKPSQTTSLSAATLVVVPNINSATGLLFHFYGALDCTTTSAAATVTVSVKFTDISNTVQTIASSVATCTALGSASLNALDYTFMAKVGTNIQYLTTIVNTPTYDVRVAVTQLGVF